MFDFGMPPQGHSNIEALIARLGVGNPTTPTQPRTIINDLDEIFSDLSTDQRREVEGNDEYMLALGNLLQKYLLYSISSTPEGINFVTNPGRKLAQNLLDTTKRVVVNLDKQKKDEISSMSEKIARLESIIIEQNRIVKDQENKLQSRDRKSEEFKTSEVGE